MAGAHPLKVKVQIFCGDEIAMGPGKADLLEAIKAEGSISAAGRKLGMSYRHTWLLVDAMNRCWSEPLVGTAAGGSHGGGAQVTAMGESVLAHYRALQAAGAALDQGRDWQALAGTLRGKPKVAQSDP